MIRYFLQLTLARLGAVALTETLRLNDAVAAGRLAVAALVLQGGLARHGAHLQLRERD